MVTNGMFLLIDYEILIVRLLRELLMQEVLLLVQIIKVSALTLTILWYDVLIILLLHGADSFNAESPLLHTCSALLLVLTEKHLGGVSGSDRLSMLGVIRFTPLRSKRLSRLPIAACTTVIVFCLHEGLTDDGVVLGGLDRMNDRSTL